MGRCNTDLEYIKQVIDEEVINYQPSELEPLWLRDVRLHAKLFNDYESFVNPLLDEYKKLSPNELLKKSRELYGDFYLSLIDFSEIREKSEEWFKFYISFLGALFEWMGLAAETSARYSEIDRLARLVANQEYLLCKIQSAVKRYSSQCLEA